MSEVNTELYENQTKPNVDGVEVVAGPPEGSNNVPLADWGTTYRPSPKSVTDFLGQDAHNGTTPQAAPEDDILPAQGYVPPSNHWGDDLTLEDRDLSTLRTDLIQQAKAGESSAHVSGAVSVGLSDMVYDPEEKAGDVIPDRDKPDNSGETEPPVEPEPEPEPEPEEPPEEPDSDESLPALP